MKRAIPLIALAVAGVCCIAAAYFCQFYYSRYQTVVTQLEDRINSFDMQLARLESEKPKHLIPSYATAEISTSDRQASHFSGSDEGNDRTLKLHIGKMHTIAPEIRIPVGSTNRLQFDIHYDEPGSNAMVGAWLSHAEPYQDLALFDEFRAYRPFDTNVIRLEVQLKPGASIKTRFTLVILHER